jgi:mannose/fructose/N-acetylgalactosamine-specific phosphotransferase system component IID
MSRHALGRKRLAAYGIRIARIGPRAAMGESTGWFLVPVVLRQPAAQVALSGNFSIVLLLALKPCIAVVGERRKLARARIDRHDDGHLRAPVSARR